MRICNGSSKLNPLDTELNQFQLKNKVLSGGPTIIEQLSSTWFGFD